MADATLAASLTRADNHTIAASTPVKRSMVVALGRRARGSVSLRPTPLPAPARHVSDAASQVVRQLTTVARRARCDWACAMIRGSRAKEGRTVFLGGWARSANWVNGLL
jgi:hypothetical protein